MGAPIIITRTPKETDDAITALEAIGGVDATAIQSTPVETDTLSLSDIIGTRLTGKYSQNLIKESNTLNTSPWSKTRVTINVSTGVPSPIAGLDYVGIIGTAESNSHFCWQQTTWLTTETRLTFGAYLKTGNVDHAVLRVYTVSNDLQVEFDLTNESYKIGIGISQVEMIKISDGEFYVNISTEVDSGEIPIFRIYPATTEGSLIYTGDGSTIDLYVAAVHVTRSKINDRYSYVTTTTTINEGLETYVRTEQYDNLDRYVHIGDSITFGSYLGSTYPRRLKSIHPELFFLNLGVSGATTDDMIRSYAGLKTKVQLLPAIGALFFDFIEEDSVYPFTSVNSATLSIDASSLKIVRDAAVDAAARIQVINKKQNITVVGQFAGDGTANVIIKNIAGDTLATSTTSTVMQDFTFTYKPTIDYDGLDFIVNGGSSSNFCNLTNLKISDDDYLPTTALFMMSGINDISDGFTATEVCDRKEFICKQASLQNVSVIALPIHPIFGAFTTDASRQTVIDINQYIYKKLQANHVVNLDALGDSDYELLSTYDSGDQLHPNELGYIKIGDLVNSQYFLGSVEREVVKNLTVMQLASSSTTLRADHDRILVDYSSTGSCTITIPDNLESIEWPGVLIVDSGDNASANNITIQDSTPTTIATISADGGSYFVFYDGSNFRAR